MQFKVEAMPTFVFMKGGKVVDTKVGADLAGIKSKIAQFK